MRRASGDRRAGIPAPLRQRGKDDHGHEEGEEEDHPPKEARARNEQRLGADPEHRAQRHLSLLWPRRVLVDPVTSSPTRGGALVPIPFANSTVSPPASNLTDGKKRASTRFSIPYVRRDARAVTTPTARASVVASVSPIGLPVRTSRSVGRYRFAPPDGGRVSACRRGRHHPKGRSWRTRCRKGGWRMSPIPNPSGSNGDGGRPRTSTPLRPAAASRSSTLAHARIPPPRAGTAARRSLSLLR